MNDIAWFVLVVDFVPFCVQYVAIAAAVLLDRSPVPVFPRWVAYLNIWVVGLFVAACSGPAGRIRGLAGRDAVRDLQEPAPRGAGRGLRRRAVERWDRASAC